ncbi:hypothetical protein KYC_12848 [Achromobacter arsenitoxydans SY8]|uniref:Uncharacterized protein n=1 Tax=Achromobacter arsenitoxydans SY8 TaxID=477184 RepID=H0F6V9_9BURK|nr:hypothetical protein KYC_12848 [Achromobacter arsenitoxydans SY8]
MDTWPFPEFPPERFAQLPVEDKELCLVMIRAYLAEIALQEQIGMRTRPAGDS